MRILSSLLLTSVLSLTLAACSAEPVAQTAPSKPTTMPDAKTVLAEATQTVVADGLKAPWGLAFLPDGGMLVTEKFGTVKRVSADGSSVDIQNVPDAVKVRQGGLQDIILSPDFTTDQTVYLSYSYGSESENGLAILKAKLDGNIFENGEVIFKSELRKNTTLHYGGRMVFMPDGMLMVASGEGSRYREKAQDLESHLGKMLRLTPNGKAAGGNPFAGNPDARKEIYSYGHRNPQGMVFDAKTGNLWAHEHGPKGGDELNLITPGTNYGWPVATFGIDYNGATISPFTEYEGMADPVHHWTPSIAPSGMTIYRGDMFPEWDGDFLVGALKFNRIHRLKMDGTRVADETIVLEIDGRVRDVRTAPDGSIYVLTDDKENGKVIRVEAKG